MRQSQPILNGNIDKDEYRISTGKVGSEVQGVASYPQMRPYH